ncbi:MAG: BrnT family toxin [Thermoanaerobaculia bacterium]
MAGGLRFEREPRKGTANVRRHGVSFEEASSAFYDEDAMVIDDPEHSESEERFVLLGLSANLRLLVVPHCYRKGGGVIRIIPAWKGDRRDHVDYFGRFRR